MSPSPPGKHSQQQQQRGGVHLSLTRVQYVGGGGYGSLPPSPARELGRLVQLQRDKLQALDGRLAGCDAELRDWEEAAGQPNEVGGGAWTRPGPSPTGPHGTPRDPDGPDRVRTNI